MPTTDCVETFIEVAEDCPVGEAEVPAGRGGAKTVAVQQYQLIAVNPYALTSDDVVVEV